MRRCSHPHLAYKSDSSNMHTHTHTNTHMHTQTHMHTHAHTNTYTQHTHANTHKHTQTHTNTHACTDSTCTHNTHAHTHTLSTSSSRALSVLSTFSLACSLAADNSFCRELSSATCCWAWSDFCFNSLSRNRTWSGDNGHHTHHRECCILLSICTYVCTQVYTLWGAEACAVNSV